MSILIGHIALTDNYFLPLLILWHLNNLLIVQMSFYLSVTGQSAVR